jgi:hypothetical protein
MQQLKLTSHVAQIIVPDETAQSDVDRLEAVPSVFIVGETPSSSAI